MVRESAIGTFGVGACVGTTVVDIFVSIVLVFFVIVCGVVPYRM
jgi:hypothetical protein